MTNAAWTTPPPAPDCPGASTLEAFALAEQGDAAIATHVASCERCRTVVDKVRRRA